MNGKVKRVVMAGFVFGLGIISELCAQSADPTTAAEGAQSAYGMTFREAWQHGGWVMWVLAGMSVFAVALVFYFMTALRNGAIVPRELVSDILAKVRSNDLSEARRLSDRHPCPFSAIVQATLDCLRNVPQCDVNLLRGAAEAEGARQAESIQGQTQLLLDVATIAPLLGLLGTVLGMLRAFSSVAHDVASAKPVVLASGVSQAIVTTIFGLIVAIPCMAFYAWFRRRAGRQISNLEAATSEVVTSIIGMGMQVDISEKE